MRLNLLISHYVASTRSSRYIKLRGQWPMEYQRVSIFPNIFVVASLCSFICLQAVYQLSGAVCKATWNGYPSYSLLTFISP